MKKNNKKGFALAEILAVAVVVMIIFMSVYKSFFPSTAEFEKRLKYNDVESLYATYYMRKIYNDFDFSSNLSSNSYVVLYSSGGQCYGFDSTSRCSTIAAAFGIEEMIVTTENIASVKTNYTRTVLKDYIDYLPNSLNDDSSEEKYRLILKTSTGYATSLLKYNDPDEASPTDSSEDTGGLSANIFSKTEQKTNLAFVAYLSDGGSL